MNFEAEIKKFTKIADQWWNKNSGPFKILHQINPIRLQFIKQQIQAYSANNNQLNIIDIGCGGGILTESLKITFPNFNIFGIDAGQENIAVATNHAAKNKLSINYINKKLENFIPDEHPKQFDVICALEIIEHVENYHIFLDNLNQLLAPNGLLFISTINRNIKSYALAIIAAEYLLKWVKPGTHNWNKFIKPHEIIRPMMDEYKYKLIKAQGMHFNLLKSQWSLNNDLGVNYIICLQKSSII